MYTHIRKVVSQFVSDFTKEELDLIEKNFYPKKLGKNEHLLQIGSGKGGVFH
jgi:cyclopropane fatty-acyl-phospholipid synthase-like methyltransferase